MQLIPNKLVRVGDDQYCHYRGQSAVVSPIGKISCHQAVIDDSFLSSVK